MKRLIIRRPVCFRAISISSACSDVISIMHCLGGWGWGAMASSSPAAPWLDRLSAVQRASMPTC
eukprot:13601523-Alexandrium_andersonii.AAC.1